MKKILFFLESLAGGGAEKVLADIVSNLDKSKYDITVCTVTDGDVYQQRVSSVCHYRSILQTSDYKSGGVRKFLFWLRLRVLYLLPAKVAYKLFMKDQYDFEIAFIEGFATKIIAASTNAKSKKIAWVHSDLLKNDHADRVYSNLEEQRNAYNKYDKIVCVSEGVRTSFGQKIFCDSRVLVQNNPIDEKLILKQAREAIDRMRPNDELLLVTVGRLEQIKGYRRLLNCVRILRDKGYRFTLWIIGKGSQQEQLEEYILEHDLSGMVKLLGFCSNPYKYLDKCDAFVCSSYAEGFSTAATESLILGKPVFTLECAGMHELIDGFGCGIIVPNTDEALCALLEDVVARKVDIEQYKRNAKKRGLAFCMDRRITEIDSLLST